MENKMCKECLEIEVNNAKWEVEVAKREFEVTPGCGAYGPRIFLKLAMPQYVQHVMDALCIWGGHDKDDERGWGWEFSETNMKYAIKFLDEEGYLIKM
jgi:hypothetical protein